MSWLEAEEFCKQKGGHLVSINSAGEQSFIESLIRDSRKENFWIGGHYQTSNGAWAWNDGSDWSYTNWDDNMPDCLNENEFYLRIKNGDMEYYKWTAHSGKWNDSANNGDDEVPLSTYGFIFEFSSGAEQRQATEPAMTEPVQQPTTEPAKPDPPQQQPTEAPIPETIAPPPPEPIVPPDTQELPPSPGIDYNSWGYEEW